MALPEICAELGLHDEAGVPVVNSRDVAERFKKRHDHVLRDIDVILGSPNLGSQRNQWFKEHQDWHIDANREVRSFDLTRQAFTLLVMGWNGEVALTFKVRYIEAFDAMETALKAQPSGIEIASMIVAGLKDAIAPLAVRFDNQDQTIEKVVHRVDNLTQSVDGLSSNVIRLELQVNKGRKKITQKNKDTHLLAIRDMGGLCPCCSERQIVDDSGKKTAVCQFDHYYASSHPNLDATWPLCTVCHGELTTGKTPRHQVEAPFRAYQGRLNRWFKQPSLF